MTDEEIRNAALIFSQLSRAIERNEKIEIEYLDKNGEIKNFNRDLNCTIASYVAEISTLGYVNLTENGISVFCQKFTDIQSITTYSKRRIELEFSETNKKIIYFFSLKKPFKMTIFQNKPPPV